MPHFVIRAESLGKRYRIGTGAAAPYKTLRESLARAAAQPVRSLARRAGRADAGVGAESTVWALRGVSFAVGHGEAVGIIGRNGAGKSTLLRILSRITDPTEGRAEVRGRVGSLLEVGTGFHPELTGRENVYLNGSILGMSRAEIARRFDEIVDFAGVAKFIDTPVKRYSSGMYLRLAFAVAAHLEPDVLIVDEVLAVGDMEFQKKCLGKMEEITGHGRTVLFVSHSMQAIAQLTSRCLVLDRGGCAFDGPTGQAVQRYLNEGWQASPPAEYQAPAAPPSHRVARARVHTSHAGGVHQWSRPAAFEFELEVPEVQDALCFSFQVVDELQRPVCHFWLLDPDVPYRTRPGRYLLRCEVPRFRLYMGSYTLTTYFTERRGSAVLEVLTGICPFEVSMHGIERKEYDWAPGACVYLEDASWAPVEHLRDP